MRDGSASEACLLDAGLVGGCSRAGRHLKRGPVTLADERARRFRALEPRVTRDIAFADNCVGCRGLMSH
eukprot:2455464-Pyramimonas_sp.AAC.1